MTPEEFLEKMNSIKAEFKDDEYTRHILMDDLMIECFSSIGYEDGAKTFSDTPKMYG